MRLYKFTCFTFLLYICVFSNEIDKNDIEFGGLLNFSIDKDYTTEDSKLTKEYTFQIYPCFNYYILNKFYFGPNLSVEYSYLKFEYAGGDGSTEYVISPGIHCGLNIVKVKSFYPYLQSSFEYNYIGTNNYLGNYYNNGIKFAFDLGLKFLIGSNLILYTQTTYSHSIKYWTDTDFKNYQEKFDFYFGLGGLIKRDKRAKN